MAVKFDKMLAATGLPKGTDARYVKQHYEKNVAPGLVQKAAQAQIKKGNTPKGFSPIPGIKTAGPGTGGPSITPGGPGGQFGTPKNPQAPQAPQQGDIRLSQNERQGGPYYNAQTDDEVARILSGYWLGEGNPYIDQVTADLQRRSDAAAASATSNLDARSRGAGQYGSSAYQAALAQSHGLIQDNLQGQIGNLLYSNYSNERQNMMAALGLSDSRDQAGWGFDVAQDQMDTQRQISSQQLSASQAAAAAQRELGMAQMQSQERQFYDQLGLSAINMFSGQELANAQLQQQLLLAGMQDDQFNSQLAGQLGLGLGAQQIEGLGMIPGLEQADYYGLNQGLGASSQQDALGIQAAQARHAAAAQNAAQQNAYNQQLWQYENNRQFQLLDQYTNTILPIAQLGGTTYSHGTNPGANVPVPSTGAATFQGALGGAAAGLGIYGQLGGGG